MALEARFIDWDNGSETQMIVVPEAREIRAIVRPNGKRQWWRAPNAETIRKEADKLLSGTGLKRAGRTKFATGGLDICFTIPLTGTRGTAQ